MLNSMSSGHSELPLPDIQVGALLNMRAAKFVPTSDTLTVSIDVMNIQKTSANAVTIDTNVFYDTEVLAIIHR